MKQQIEPLIELMDRIRAEINMSPDSWGRYWQLKDSLRWDNEH